MKVQREQPPFSTISGTSVRLSDRDTIAIYRWDDCSWVAHFRDDGGELSDATTWFRVHAGWLRSCRVGSLAALETVEVLTPEWVARIAQLHQRAASERGRRLSALQHFPMTGCAERSVSRLASGGLIGGKDSVPHRTPALRHSGLYKPDQRCEYN